MFVLPYFIYSAPEIARSLEEYRWLSLPGAHKKAAGNHYEGAQFPWESAWIDDGEVTPVWGAADIVTGLPTKIWSGFIEQHITADVAYGAWEYYQATGDQDFMDRCGYELILDTGKFWASRLEEGQDGKLHINDVVGPDEYKEHVDDNAFTNYMAAWNIRKALEYSRMLKANRPDLYQALDAKLGLTALEPQWEDKLSRIYLPQPREDLVIPQDRTYLTLKDIDLTKYKNQQNVGSIYRDYNQEQITHMQVSKQADILIMFLLLEDEFSAQVKRANWNYYEPRTLHDSSLSLSTPLHPGQRHGQPGSGLQPVPQRGGHRRRPQHEDQRRGHPRRLAGRHLAVGGVRLWRRAYAGRQKHPKRRRLTLLRSSLINAPANASCRNGGKATCS